MKQKTAKNENAITLFPNPFKNWLNIKTTQNEWQHYKILNFQGKTIEEGNFKNESHQVDLNHLEEGVYFFQLSTYGRQDNTKNTVVNQKIIKH